MVTQIEVDQELHTKTPSRLTLNRTKEKRDAMLDQVGWKDFVEESWVDSRPN